MIYLSSLMDNFDLAVHPSQTTFSYAKRFDRVLNPLLYIYDLSSVQGVKKCQY